MNTVNPLPIITSRKLKKDSVTPYKIALLVFIKEFSVLKEKDEDASAAVPIIDILRQFSITKRKRFSMFVLHAVRRADVTWEDFYSRVCSQELELPALFVERFVAAFQKLIEDGVAGIMDVSESCLNLTRQPDDCLIGKSSVVGFFIRKLWLQIEELTFSESVQLNEKLTEYFTKSKEPCYCSASEEHLFRQMGNTEFFVHRQQLLLQRNETRALDYGSLKSAVQGTLRKKVDAPEVYYLLHTNSLRVKNFTDAECYLHHAFDQSCSTDVVASTLPAPDERVISKIYGSAVFDLALVHSSLGHNKDAMSALKEAIQKYEDSGDIVLLQQSLAWLCKLGSKYYSQKRLRMLETLIKSNETNPQHLVSYGLQVWIQNAMTKDIDPSEILACLQASEMKNSQRSYNDLALSALVLRAALYNFYGYSLNACVASQQALILQTKDPTRGSISYDNESSAVAFINLANHLGRCGLYQDMDLVLQMVKEQYAGNHRCAHLWKTTRLHWNFYRLLWMGSFDEALQAAADLTHLDPLDGLCKMAEAQLYRGGYQESMKTLEILEEYLRSVDEEDTPSKLRFVVKHLILFAVTSNAMKAREEALEKLIAATVICRKHRMFLMLALVNLQIAALQLQLNLGQNALQLIDDTADMLWTSSSVLEQGLTLYLRSQCLLSSGPNDLESRKVVLQWLSQANDCFDRAGAYCWMKETILLQMLVWNSLGERQRRNKCALEYRQLEERFPNNSTPTLIVFAGL